MSALLDSSLLGRCAHLLFAAMTQLQLGLLFAGVVKLWAFSESSRAPRKTEAASTGASSLASRGCSFKSLAVELAATMGAGRATSRALCTCLTGWR